MLVNTVDFCVTYTHTQLFIDRVMHYIEFLYDYHSCRLAHTNCCNTNDRL